MWLALTLLLITLLIYYLKRNYSYWKRHNIPAPDPTWLVGNLGPCFNLSKHFGHLVDEWYYKFADSAYFGYYKCLSPSICVRDPNLIKDVLIREFQSFEKNDMGFDEEADPLLKHNPFMTIGEDWKASRAVLTPLFTANKIKTLSPLMKRACLRLIDYITELGPNCDFNAKELASKFTAENVAMVGFSLDAEAFSKPDSEFREMALKIFEPTTKKTIQFAMMLFLPPLVKLLKISFLPKDVDEWIRKLVEQNVKSRETIELTNNDLLHMMLEQQDKLKLSDEQVTGHSLAFVTEGTETSSTLLCNAMYELASYSDIQERLYDEITEVLAQHDDDINYDAIQKMSYLDGVIYETLRTKSIFMTMHKVCTKTYKLPPLSGQTKGFLIPKGMGVLIPVNSLHFDPQYFPNPHKFDPTRHSEENAKSRLKCSFLPFGEGPRMCMGLRFAMTQTKAALIHIMRSFKIKISPNCKSFVLNPVHPLCTSIDPLLLNFEPRDI